MTSTGKIARLPREIRDQLTRRLQNGEPGKKLVAWLNSLPETQQVLAAGFGGRPINEQNLSAWKNGAYQHWLERQETFAQARDLAPVARQLNAAADGQLTDHLSTVLAARYATALAQWNGEPTEEFRRKLRLLRGLCQGIVQLRRADQSNARMDLQHEQLDWEREKSMNT